MNLPSVLSPDFGLLFWMLIAFLVVFALLAKFGFPVITGMVEERKKFIDESLQSAREANERLASIHAESETLLKEAREKQAQILSEAKYTSQAIIAEARTKAETESSKMLNEAKAQILAEKESALRDIRAQVADLSVGIAKKIMRNELEKDGQQEKFVKRLLEEI